MTLLLSYSIVFRVGIINTVSVEEDHTAIATSQAPPGTGHPKSTRYYGLYPTVLRELVEATSAPLATIIQAPWNSGTVPED